MAWIELHDTLPDHPKVIDLAAECKMDKDLVLGKLIRLWVWALLNREDGSIRKRDVSTLGDILRIRGNPQKFVDALVSVRLLDVTDDGYCIHDWDEHVAMLMDKRERQREQARNRKKRQREKERDMSRVEDDDCHADVTRDSHASHAVTVPNRTYTLDDIDPTTARDSARARAREVIHNMLWKSTGEEPAPIDVELLEPLLVPDDAESQDLMQYAINLAMIYGARNTAAYAWKVLHDWQRLGISTVAAAKAWRGENYDL